MPRTSRAQLAFRRNPHAAAPDREAPLVLDGEQQDEVRVELDGVPLPAGRLRVRRRHARRARSARRRRAHRPLAHRAGAQRRARGPLRVVGRVLHAMRAGRVSPHHVLSRPSRRPRPLHGDAARRSQRVSGAAVERQSRGAGRARRRAALTRSGTTRFRSRRTCSRSSPAISRRSRTRSRRCPDARSR